MDDAMIEQLLLMDKARRSREIHGDDWPTPGVVIYGVDRGGPDMTATVAFEKQPDGTFLMIAATVDPPSKPAGIPLNALRASRDRI